MPRHIRNMLIAALLAVLALTAGINGYIHHQFKTNIDNALSSLQVFARVKYSDLSTSILSGEVTLENVRISAALLPEEINLGNVTLETPGFAYMLNGPENIKKGEFPNQLNACSRYMRVNASSVMVKAFLGRLISYKWAMPV